MRLTIYIVHNRLGLGHFGPGWGHSDPSVGLFSPLLAPESLQAEHHVSGAEQAVLSLRLNHHHLFTNVKSTDKQQIQNYLRQRTAITVALKCFFRLNQIQDHVEIFQHGGWHDIMFGYNHRRRNHWGTEARASPLFVPRTIMPQIDSYVTHRRRRI